MDKKNTAISEALDENISEIQKRFGKSFDLIIREIKIGAVRAAAVSVDGMCSELKITEAVLKPLTDKRAHIHLGENIYESIKLRLFKGTDVKTLNSIEEITDGAIAGNFILLADKETSALSFSMQGFPKKSIQEPQAEQNERGSQEGFTDSFKDNATLLRRRIRSCDLIVEQTTAGTLSNTPVLICYIESKVSRTLLEKVKKRLKKANLEAVFGSGYLRPFLDSESPTLFMDTGLTERPDTLAAMLTEGRIGIIVDGTPFAIIVPYLLIDYFHTVDDYLTPPVYALFMRVLRILCFSMATILPGLFVAVCLFHPEVIPADIMYEIASAESKTPFPIAVEALLIHFIYEIVREAGLRMPIAIGHAVSIVGALVIGDAAVTAGLIAAPMLIVVALTAISSAAVAKMHETVAIMRFAFIIIGGFTGLYGVMLAIGVMIIDICSINPFGIPFSAPFSPYVKKAQQDGVIRKNWRKRRKKNISVQDMKFS